MKHPKSNVTAAVAALLIASCGGGSSGSVTNPTSPANLAYSVNPAVYTVGAAITPNTPSSTGGAVVSYSVTPGLPAGLYIDSVGVIRGTPTAVAGTAVYTVSATNGGGSTTASLTITVNPATVPPSNLTYSVNPAVYTVGAAITPNTPSSSGDPVTSYRISPPPPGLNLTTSGVLWGTPTAASTAAVYVVTASNAGGSTTASLTITVNAPTVPPSNLTYSVNPAVYTIGVTIAPNAPSSTGGAVVSYSVTPGLPAGLYIDSAGVIRGTPTAVAGTAVYTVSATNGGGSTTASLTITVNPATVPPSNLTYSVNPAVYTVGAAITPNTPSSSGDPVTSYRISPPPPGLNLTTSGVLWGTPTAASTAAVYVVTASNAGGSTTASLTITVNAPTVPPSNLTYSVNPAVYTIGVTIAPNAPSSTGGAVVSYSVTPGLPAGLYIDSAGVIRGTPTAVAGTAVYTVSATNGGGSTTASLSMTVNRLMAPPSNLAYSVNPATHIVGGAISPNAPTNDGGTTDSYSVTPALPPGLYMDSLGVIRGTPTTATTPATYLVTATNPWGSTNALVNISVVGPWSTVAAGYQHTVAIKQDGTLWTWGEGWSGKLGDGTNSNRTNPVLIGNGYSSASAGRHHTLAIKTDGVLWGWGGNVDLQLGASLGAYQTVPAQLGTGYALAAAGAFHTVAIKTDRGALWAWGNNSFGQLGTPIPLGYYFTTASAGSGDSFAIGTSWGLLGCGNNSDGQLGVGSTAPNSGQWLTIGQGFVAVAAGAYHAVALKSDGTLWTWGRNAEGQLGDGTMTARSAPVQIGSGYASVAAGWHHTMAIKSDGTLWAWGKNLDGQLGDGTTTGRASPVLIGSGYASVAAGLSHTVAVKTDGSLWAWGGNSYGQLGDGSTSSRYAPVQVPQ
jgi:alpha-tubulin suppressor-like RCC1 family protein